MSRTNRPAPLETIYLRAAIITHTTAVIRGPQHAAINVQDARSQHARIIVNWNGMMLTFRNAEATQGLLEAFTAARASLARLSYELPEKFGPTTEPAARSTLAIDWLRRPRYSAVTQSAPGHGPHASSQNWVELYTESLTWQIRDIIGHRTSIEALRHIHRTAAAIFLDGDEHRTDPSADEPLTATA